jgi:methyl-accepting chemotaxis protein
VDNLTKIKASGLPGMDALATAALTDLAAYDVFTQRVRTDVQAGIVKSGVQVMTVDNLDASTKLDASINAVLDNLSAQVASTQEAANAAVTRWIAVLLVLVLIGLVLAAVIVLKVINSITRPLADIEAALGSLAEGDLKVRALVKTNDELGRVATSLNTAAAAQQASVAAIGENAQTLAAAAEELTATSSVMSEAAGATTSQAYVVAEQSTGVNENVQAACVAAEELTASIAAISANAWEAARVASTAVEVAGLTSAIMNKLGASSADIGNVIKEIKGVAEQTNLLALNATIESARAGEAGKGFAVVASEVKDLARATAAATTDITAKIQAISDDTLEAIGAIEQISGTINQINEIQHTIASAVEEQSAAVNEIARSMSMAADGSGQITLSIDGVNTSAQSASSGAAQTGQAANELAQMASSLEGLVSSFRC